jgi:hypothetical protein
MSQKIFSTFLGLGDSDRNLPEGQFYAGRDIDLYRDYGYMRPGFLHTDIADIGLVSGVIDIIYDSAGSFAYLLTDGAKIHCINTANDTDVGVSFNGGTANYVSIAGMSEAKGIISYSGTDSAYRAYIFYTGTANNIAMAPIGTNNWSTLDADWGSTVASGGATLNAGRRDAMEWRSFLWYTNGRYLGKLDTYSNPAVAVPQFYDLGADWSSDRLFQTNNYLGIVASKISSTFIPGVRNPNPCRVYLIDLAGNLQKIIDLENISQVHAVHNDNGTILMFCDNGSGQHIIATLQDEGLGKLKVIQHDVGGAMIPLTSPQSSSNISFYKNNILFGTRQASGLVGGSFIMSYGRKSVYDEFQLACPMSLSIVNSSQVSSIKQLTSNKFYVGYFDGTNYKLGLFKENYSTTASYKAGYVDFSQKVKVNYVEVFFKTLVTNDSITVGLDVDYGTSKTLGIGTGNISYTKDGAKTSKKFTNLGFQCHAFRPTITWGAGGVAISKIVIDYTFIQ